MLTDSLRQKLVAEGYTVDAASSGAEALGLFERGGHHLTICDLHLPDTDGMEILRRIKHTHPLAEVIVVTDYASVERVVEATKAGAFWFLEKPFAFGVLLPLIERALERQELMAESKTMHRQLSAHTKYSNITGSSRQIQQIHETIALLAKLDASVLIGGEPGTGRELAARALHQNSPRRERPFVAINCALLTESFLELELFGHEPGAFTGALTQKKGKLEVADGGTLFLEEIHVMPATIQAKLLRVIQEREVERLGGTRKIRVDVRIVAAANRELEEAVSAGAFRHDLYYRLNVVSFEMPPLRERREDIPLLASHFIAKYAAKFERRVTGLSPEAQELLVNYEWPGNVRELENTIERVIALSSTERVMPEDLPDSILKATPASDITAPPIVKYHDAIFEAKKQILLGALEQSYGDYSEAARSLGLHPTKFHRLIRDLKLHLESKK